MQLCPVLTKEVSCRTLKLLQVYGLDFSKGQGLVRLGQPAAAPDRFHKLAWGTFATSEFSVSSSAVLIGTCGASPSFAGMHACIT
jgi:hypothetical protein